MARCEPAELFWGDDFYNDEHVLRMSYEDQGVYRRLLWISRRNGGLPDDPAAIAELLQLPLRGLSAKRFLDKVWPRIAPCWTAADGRLHQRRQEEELQRRAAARGGEIAGEDTTSRAKDPQRQAAALARWGKRSASPQDAAASARMDAPHDARNAAADADRNAVASSPPVPPSVQVQEEQPPDERARMDAPHDAAASPAAGASASKAEPESPESDRDEVIQLQRALLKTTYRNQMPTWGRRAAMLHVGRQLAEQGATVELIEQVWAIAQEHGDEPGGLLAHWIEGGIGALRSVVDEQAMKQKEAALRSRRPEDADLLAGVYEG